MSKKLLDDDKVKLKAIKLRDEGKLSFRDISANMGIPETTVRFFLQQKSHREWWANRRSSNKSSPKTKPTRKPRKSPADEAPVKLNLRDDSTKEVVYQLNSTLGYSDISRQTGISKTAVREFLTGQIYHDWWEIKDPSRINKEFKRSKTKSGANMSLDDDSVKLLVIKLSNTPDITITEICDLTGISRRSVEYFLSQATHTEFWDAYEGESEAVFNGTMEEPEYDDELLDAYNVFVVTSAQNNTHVNMDFLKSLESYCVHNHGKLLIAPYVYNLDGILGSKQDAIVYDAAISHHLVKEPKILSEYLGGLVFCAELDILPTASSPLSGLQTYTKQASGIFPHAKLQLESVPTHKSDPCRMLYTTGTITQRNYIARKAGQKASFHHVFGALVVEVDHKNKCWYVRQLNADKDGSFQDLGKVYMPDGSVKGGLVEAINWGDIHAEKCEDEQVNLYFGTGGILDILKPKYQFIHDLSDFTPRNHHNRNDPHFLYKTSLSEIRTVEDGLNQAADILKKLSRDWCETLVVNSNHDNAYEKWLREADYRHDPDNALFFLKSQLRCYEAIQKGDTNYSVFEDALTNLVSRPVNHIASRIRFLRVDESFKICIGAGEIECSAHGDLGANGTRGSAAGFQRLGTKVNIGHSHTAAIRDGVYQAGVTGSLDMGYNKGPSSWSRSHILSYPNGKRCIITTHGTGWCLADVDKVKVVD